MSSEQNRSISGPAGFNSRVSPPDQPKSATPRVEGTPVLPVHAPRFITSASDLTPSEAPVLDLPSTKTIADGVRQFLAENDRNVAAANGADPIAVAMQQTLARIGAGVKSGAYDETTARKLWDGLYPGVDPNSVAGGQSS